MTRLSGLLLALMIGGGFCLLLVLGNAVMAVLCRVCRPLEEWRERGIELLEMQEDEE
ncbi:MAG: hypothetical protein IIT77_05795 [Oscillospiraceae bacterium]|nr:hypothetical protein [Oscillospiraceae bacterium]